MITGLELTALVLAVFPLVISGLEHYEGGCSSVKEWIQFRAEFVIFMNALCRQQIFFRQNIEDLLSAVVESEYEMARMLDNPADQSWKDPKLEARLRQRLSGRLEYECYMTIVSSINKLLDKFQRKLKIQSDEPHWSQTTGMGIKRIEFELRRLAYVLSSKRRLRLMDQLAKYNDEMQKLLGNSDRLEPVRKKRHYALPKSFQQLRTQVSSFHAAVAKAARCNCEAPHSTKILLPSSEGDAGELRRLSIYFLLQSGAFSSPRIFIGPDVHCYAAEVEMVADEAQQKYGNQPAVDDVSVYYPNRTVSFQDRRVSQTSTLLSRISEEADEISDLCTALKQNHYSKQWLGYFRDRNQYHTIRIASNGAMCPSQIQQVITLEAMLTRRVSSSTWMSRQTRLATALAMAKSLLQLYPGPWMRENWGKKDIYFFVDDKGEVQAHHPLLVSTFTSAEASQVSSPMSARHVRHDSRTALLSLGILILELWFNQTIESRPYRQRFLGPDSCENEYTNFNTAQKWQEQALEEGGLDLHNLTRRCIYCAFGAASQDLSDKELRHAVYDEVVTALERLLARYKEI